MLKEGNTSYRNFKKGFSGLKFIAFSESAKIFALQLLSGVLQGSNRGTLPSKLCTTSTNKHA